MPLVIINPKSAAGATKDRWAATASDLRAHFGAFQVAFTKRQGDGVELAKRSAETGRKFIIACGGDGTINEVANGLLGQDRTCLAIVPAGRGVDLLRSLGGRYWPATDLASLLTTPPRRIDLGLATVAGGACRAFLNVAGVGFDAEVARRSARSRLPGRHAPYLAALAGAVIGYRNQEMSVDIDGRRFTGTMRAVLAANGRFFGGGFEIVPSAALDDGLLDAAIIGDIGRLDLLRTVPSLYRGRHTNHPCFRHVPARAIRVETALPARVEVDGELAGEAPVVFSVLPGALRIVL